MTEQGHFEGMRFIMMLYPPVADLVEKAGSRYQLVNLIARRARHISVEAEASGEPLDQKPVSQAVEEVYAGKLQIIRREESPQGEA